VSIRVKVIFPYLLLTLAVAIVGTYVVTQLVSSSLSERLTNQLLEAGRVVSDGMARQEIKHLETARLVAYTNGLAEALANDDKVAVKQLAQPLAAGLDAENLILIDTEGNEMLHLLKRGGQFESIDELSGAANLSIVQSLLASNDSAAQPKRQLGIHSVDQRYYYFTAIPVPEPDGTGIVGVVMVGTSLETLLPQLKSMALSDIILYGQDGQAIATTLGGTEGDDEFVASLSIPPELYDQLVKASNTVSGENFTAFGRWYSLARAALKVGSDRLGVFGVVLPLNFVLQAGANSRTTYVVIFSLAMIGVVFIGYFISRLITGPLGRLVNTSQAIAQGDLSQRTGIRRTDEIGLLANTFDGMTQNLEERTKELERAYQALEQMDRAKSSFIAVAAHELRTPLTLIGGYSQMIKMDVADDPDLDELARGVIDGTKRMSDVVDSMLDVSRIDNQTLDVVSDNFGIAMVLERVYTDFSKALQERQLTLDTEQLYDLPPIQADPELLYKVFNQLVMNAIKYTPDGGTITVTGQVIESDGTPLMEIVVADTGIGIAPEHIELIFEKFYQTGEVQVHSSGKTKFKGGGPGLGLAIARGIVEAHGGSIWAESPGYDESTCPGSRFIVRLPMQRNDGS